jgi:hypothetical protein
VIGGAAIVLWKPSKDGGGKGGSYSRQDDERCGGLISLNKENISQVQRQLGDQEGAPLLLPNFEVAGDGNQDMVRASEALPEETGSNKYAQSTSQAPSPDPTSRPANRELFCCLFGSCLVLSVAGHSVKLTGG